LANLAIAIEEYILKFFGGGYNRIHGFVRKNMRQLLITATLFYLASLAAGCRGIESRAGSNSDQPVSNYNLAASQREIVAANVLAVQLARHDEIETKKVFTPNEPVYASVYLIDPRHVEPRRISALLICDETVVEEQSIAVGADETRQEFDFSFTRTPRPPGAYQIKFVEIARSNGTPVLLARLFLHVE
jgi:hypothetical protein